VKASKLAFAIEKYMEEWMEGRRIHFTGMEIYIIIIIIIIIAPLKD